MGKQVGTGAVGHTVSMLNDAVRRELPELALQCLSLAAADFWQAEAWRELLAWFEREGHSLGAEAAGVVHVLLAQYQCRQGAQVDAATHAWLVFNAPDAPAVWRLKAARVLVWVSLDATHHSEVQEMLARVRSLCDAHRHLDESVHARSHLALAGLVALSGAAGTGLPAMPTLRALDRGQAARLRAYAQQQLDELDDALRRSPSGERSDVAPLLVMVLLLFVSAGRSAAEFTLGRARRMFGAEHAEACDTVAAMVAHGAADPTAVLAVLNPARTVDGTCLIPALQGLRQVLASQACSALGRHDEAVRHLSRYASSLHNAWRGDVTTLALASARAERLLQAPQLPAAPSRVRRSQPPCLQRALNDIEAHLDRAVDVARIVAASGVSRRTLETTFRRHLDTSICEAAKSAKLQHASQLLRQQGLPVADVRARVGYTSASCFSRDFRAQFGVAPSVLRSERENG